MIGRDTETPNRYYGSNREDFIHRYQIDFPNEI